jgi:hypothetical protein
MFGFDTLFDDLEPVKELELDRVAFRGDILTAGGGCAKATLNLNSEARPPVESSILRSEWEVL